MPLSPADAALLTAIESGTTEAVSAALAQGADPNTRKRVCLSVTLPDPLGGTRELSDTAPCESALCLAVLLGRADAVELLLKAGANSETPIAWKVANCVTTWTEEVWDRQRWVASFSYPGALALATGSGVQVVGPNAVDDPAVSSDGQYELMLREVKDANVLRVNKPGTVVELVAPKEHAERCVEVQWDGAALDVVGLLEQVDEDGIPSPHWAFTHLTGPTEKRPKVDLTEQPVFAVGEEFEPRTEDELALTTDDEIRVLTVFRDGWAQGASVKTQSTGLFPLDHLKLGVDPPELAPEGAEVLLTKSMKLLAAEKAAEVEGAGEGVPAAGEAKGQV